jgi:hypothetical protein
VISLSARVALVFVILTASTACSSTSDKQRLGKLESEVQVLQDRVRRLSYNTASGGGVNVKMMPDPVTGKPTVPLEEVFSFDRNHALCRVDTNRKAFKMRTFKLGEVTIQPHKFFMSMVATTIDQYEISTRSDGKRQVTMRGGLSFIGQFDATECLAGGGGFEPPLTGPEPVVLPLDDPPALKSALIIHPVTPECRACGTMNGRRPEPRRSYGAIAAPG